MNKTTFGAALVAFGLMTLAPGEKAAMLTLSVPAIAEGALATLAGSVMRIANLLIFLIAVTGRLT